MPGEGRRGREAGSTWGALRSVTGQWRLASVALLSFSSGLPLGLVWIAIPAWMARAGVDIKIIGLFTLAQAPWTFKLLWSPSMDRYRPPFLGRKRGWILLSQVGLFAATLGLAGVSSHPEAVWVIGGFAFAIALASATQDVAFDAYAVEVLRREEQGLATGVRFATYRWGMYASGSLAITLAAETSWAFVNLVLALLYVPMMLVAAAAPEPEALPTPPLTLREAVFGPFVDFLAQHRALEILAFVVLYKLSDNLTQALTRPFLVQLGFDDYDVGLWTGTVAWAAFAAGTLVGGVLTDRLGLGRALWVFGLLQLFSNLGYAAVAHVGINRPLMYSAVAFELGSSGLGSGAFGVLLLRLTRKRFSATQYALLSSLFTLPRVLSGPVAGVLADAIGWRDFFVLTVLFGVPGMAMLGRFVPWGVRDVEFDVRPPARGVPVSRATLAAWSVAGTLLAGTLGLAAVGLVGGLQGLRAGRGLTVLPAMAAVLRPQRASDWTTAAGIVVLAALAGLATAATVAARRGVATSRSAKAPEGADPGGLSRE